MRGKEKHCYNFADNRGITPAYAGKSVEVCEFLNNAEDHPRLCGEKKKLKVIRIMN